jgi:tetratricopeptide (TPR) repeat protein
MDDTLEAERALGRPVEEIARTRANRATVLLHMPGRIDEAKAELEACLTLFESDPAMRAAVLSSLADVLKRQGDIHQAIIQVRRSLAIREQLPNPANRAGSHNNLANYLERSGTPSALAESSFHRLADLIYTLVAGLGESLKTLLGNYAIGFRRARAAGSVLAVPRVEELLANPAFAPLAQWLSNRKTPVDQLQTAVDQGLDAARNSAVSEDAEGMLDPSSALKLDRLQQLASVDVTQVLSGHPENIVARASARADINDIAEKGVQE